MNEYARAGIDRGFAEFAEELAATFLPDALDGASSTTSRGGLQFTFQCVRHRLGADGLPARSPLPLPPTARESVVLIYHAAFDLLTGKNPPPAIHAEDVQSEVAGRRCSAECESSVSQALSALVWFGYLRRTKKSTYHLPDVQLPGT